MDSIVKPDSDDITGEDEDYSQDKLVDEGYSQDKVADDDYS